MNPDGGGHQGDHGRRGGRGGRRGRGGPMIRDFRRHGKKNLKNSPPSLDRVFENILRTRVDRCCCLTKSVQGPAAAARPDRPHRPNRPSPLDRLGLLSLMAFLTSRWPKVEYSSSLICNRFRLTALRFQTLRMFQKMNLLPLCERNAPTHLLLRR